MGINNTTETAEEESIALFRFFPGTLASSSCQLHHSHIYKSRLRTSTAHSTHITEHKTALSTRQH